jgi:hypothetical protein
VIEADWKKPSPVEAISQELDQLPPEFQKLP